MALLDANTVASSIRSKLTTSSTTDLALANSNGVSAVETTTSTLTPFKADDAVSAVAVYSAKVAVATEVKYATKHQYQVIFDQIKAAAQAGNTSKSIKMTQSQYDDVKDSLVEYGYTVGNLVSSEAIISWGSNNITAVVATPLVLTGLNPADLRFIKAHAYSAKLYPQGGVGPYTFSLVAGCWPESITANYSNENFVLVEGTPTITGDDYATILVTDSKGQTLKCVVKWNVTAVAAAGASIIGNSGLATWLGEGATAADGGTSIGYATTSNHNSISIGVGTGSINSYSAVNIGENAGHSSGNGAINLGYYTGTTGAQGNNAIAIGYNAAVNSQGENAIAIGKLAGFGSDTNSTWTLQGYNNPAITDTQGTINTGVYLWNLNVGSRVQITGIAIGTGSITGYSSGSTYYVIAWNGGTIQLSTSKGGSPVTTVAGSFSGVTITALGNTQASNTIIINATGSVLEGVASQPNSCYIAPVRAITSTSGFKQAYYNPTTGELVYLNA